MIGDTNFEPQPSAPYPPPRILFSSLVDLYYRKLLSIVMSVF